MSEHLDVGRPTVEEILQEWADGGAYGENSHFIREFSKVALSHIANLSSRCESLLAELAAVREDAEDQAEQAQEAHQKSSAYLNGLISEEKRRWCEVVRELAAERESREFWKSGWYALDKDNQDLRQVVKEYRESDDHQSCDDWTAFAHDGKDNRCSPCIKADALLAPKPAEGEN